MKPAQLLVSLAALSIAACDNPEQPAIASAETVTPPPAAPVSDIAVSAQDITFLYGRGHLRIPDGWQPFPKPELPLELEIEATRYKADGDRWAMCRLTKLTMPSLVPVTQDAMNRYVEKLWEGTIEDLAEEGTPVEVTYPLIGDDLRAKRMRFAKAGEAEIIVNAIVVADGMLFHGALISCDTAHPATERDLADIAAFAGSFRHEP